MSIAALPQPSCSTTHFRYEKGFFCNNNLVCGFGTASLCLFRGTQRLFSQKYVFG